MPKKPPKKPVTKWKSARGMFTGKTIKLAPQRRLSRKAALLEDLLVHVVKIQPQDCLVTDRSSLTNFEPIGSLPGGPAAKRWRATVIRRAKARYGVDITVVYGQDIPTVLSYIQACLPKIKTRSKPCSPTKRK